MISQVVSVCMSSLVYPHFSTAVPEVDGFFVQQSGLGVVAGDAGEGVGEGGEGGRRVACRGKDLLQVSFFPFSFSVFCIEALVRASRVWGQGPWFGF